MELHYLKDCEKSVFKCDSCSLLISISNLSSHDCKEELIKSLE